MPSTRDRLRALVRAEPHLNQTELAARLGVTRQRVQQLADAEELTLERGPRGVGGRKSKPKVTETAPGVTGGVSAIPSGTSPAVAVLLTAADLTSRGYTVFLPLTQTAHCDLVAISSDDRVERIVVRKARRAGGEIRYDDPGYGGDRRALILTDETIQYEPGIEKPRRT